MINDDVKVMFGNALRRAREEKGLSQEELSFISGLHRTYVGSVERGERNVSLVNITRLAKAVEVSSSDLLKMAGM